MYIGNLCFVYAASAYTGSAVFVLKEYLNDQAQDTIGAQRSHFHKVTERCQKELIVTFIEISLLHVLG